MTSTVDVSSSSSSSSPSPSMSPSRTPMPVDAEGLPIIPPPAAHDSKLLETIRKGIFLTIVPVVAPVVICTMYLCKSTFRDTIDGLYRVVYAATLDPVQEKSYFQDKELLKQLYKLPSVQPYLRNGSLLYQKSEGFCSSATLQSILLSFDKFPTSIIPNQIPAPSNPEKWTVQLQELAKNIPDHSIETEVVYGGDVSYEAFLKTLKRLEHDPECRIAINYLRPALVGFQKPMWLPFNLLLGLLGGHFSPVLGILPAATPASTNSSSDDNNDYDKNPLVAVFDVNAKWGTCIVPAKRLFASIQAMDIGTRKSRALIVLEHTCTTKMD